MQAVDVIVLGAGAAGLFCAGLAGQRGLRVLLLDHAPKVGEKIRISGGGRCNFTNRECSAANFLSDNPAFCRSALARFRPADFIDLVDKYRIAHHEKHRGQLFCDGPSEQIVQMLLSECSAGAVQHWQPCEAHSVRQCAGGFDVDTSRGTVTAHQLVVATGGLSIPKLGSSDLGYRLARQFGHRVIEPRPALVPLTFDAAAWAPFTTLAGVSLEVDIRAGTAPQEGRFLEDLLFTHRGLSGPAVLQASSYWRAGEPLQIDLLPGQDLAAMLQHAKATSRRQLANELSQHLPQRLAQAWLSRLDVAADQPMPQVRDRDLKRLAADLATWRVTPTGSEGWRKAEVTAGGVDTRELSSQSMQSLRAPGLHFIGEVLDVTGWLGGYNFQWAWASAAACATALVVAALVAGEGTSSR
jgi:predicted Rossmann fold flavoprotein